MNQSAPAYVDVIFLINFVMDFFIMWATGKLVGVKVIYLRIAVASILGAIYSVGAIFIELSAWYDFPIKVLFSGLLVILALWPGSWRQFLKSWACFYLVSFAMAGAVVGLSYIFQSIPREPVSGFSYTWLGGGVACALVLGKYGDRMIRERVVPQLMKCPVQVRFGTNWCRGLGFIDTGHNLLDPLTRRPVVIAEYTLLSECFPHDVKEALAINSDDDQLFETLALTSWAHRLRLIPFTSIGKRHGLLVGVRSDELAVQSGDRWLTFPEVVIGLYKEELSPEGSFQMLLPASILRK